MAAHRIAKINYWEFDQTGPSPLFTFGMSGSFHLEHSESLDYKAFKIDTASFPPRNSRIVFEFENNIRLAYVCIRGFARVHLFDNPVEELPIREYAPDPVHNMPNRGSFHSSLMRFSKGIKAVLLEQKGAKGVVCGLGNWLCDDILYAAGVDPDTKTNALDEDQTGRIHAAVVQIISVAIECNANQASFPSHWLFHKRWSKKPKKEDLMTDDGHTISIKKSGGRTTYYVRAALIKKGSRPSARRVKREGSSSSSSSSSRSSRSSSSSSSSSSGGSRNARGKSGKVGKVGKGGKGGKSGKSGTSGKSGKSGKNGKSGKSGKGGKSGKSKNSGKNEKNEKSEKSESGKSKSKSMKSTKTQKRKTPPATTRTSTRRKRTRR